MLKHSPIHISSTKISLVDLWNYSQLLLGETSNEAWEFRVAKVNECNVSRSRCIKFMLSEKTVGKANSRAFVEESNRVDSCNTASVSECFSFLFSVVGWHRDDGLIVLKIIERDNLSDISEHCCSRLFWQKRNILPLVTDFVSDFSICILSNLWGNPLGFFS